MNKMIYKNDRSPLATQNNKFMQFKKYHLNLKRKTPSLSHLRKT
jgi:hypothetical protein